MTYERCEGLSLELDGFLRCFNCGDLIDSTVLANRAIRPISVPEHLFSSIDHWQQYLEKIGKVCYRRSYNDGS